MGLLVGLPLKLLSPLLLLLRLGWPILLLLLILFLLRRRRRRAADPSRENPHKEPEFDGPVYTVDYEDVDSDENS